MNFCVKVAYNKVVNHFLILQIVAYYMVCYANFLGPVYGVLVLGLVVIYVGNNVKLIHVVPTISQRLPPSLVHIVFGLGFGYSVLLSFWRKNFHNKCEFLVFHSLCTLLQGRIYGWLLDFSCWVLAF